jgi:hypothetical protein
MEPCKVKLAGVAEFMFRSNVAETTAAGSAAISPGEGERSTTSGGGFELEADSSPEPSQPKTPNTQQMAVNPAHRTFFKPHLLL